MAIRKGFFVLALGAIICVTLTAGQDPEPTVQVDLPDLGPIQGALGLTSRDQRPYYTFFGIPYADVNSYVGKGNRFKPSKIQSAPLTTDGSVFEAKELLIYCPQEEVFDLDGNGTKAELSQNIPEIYRRIHRKKRQNSAKLRQYSNSDDMIKAYREDNPYVYMGQEDCLTININTPRIPKDPFNETELLPVVVFYHGGGSDSVWGSAFTAFRMLEYDVILITMNYRLGVLGALNLGIDEAPGNAGQYDGIVCLEWVQKYIRYFGGNPNLVTISGQSAGAMMVTNLMITPLVKDRNLFHRVWGMSGTAIAVWAISEEPSLPHHLEIAKLTGCRNETDNDVNAIAECMQNAELSDLVTAMAVYKHNEEYKGRLGFDAKMPSIQNPSISHPIFMPKHPYEALKAREQMNVPVVLGSTRHDGSFPLDDIYENFIKPHGHDKNETFLRNDLMPTLLRTLGIIDDTGELYHVMASMFLRNASLTGTMQDKLPGMIDMVTVMAYKAGAMEMLRFQEQIGAKGFFYSLDYYGRWSMYNLLWGESEIPGGICHTDDLIYFFWLGPLLNDDMKVSRRWMQYYINFVIHGDPNGPTDSPSVWPAYDPILQPFLKFDRWDTALNHAPDYWVGAADELFENDEGNNPTTTVRTTTGISDETTDASDATDPSGETTLGSTQSTDPTSAAGLLATSTDLLLFLTILLFSSQYFNQN